MRIARLLAISILVALVAGLIYLLLLRPSPIASARIAFQSNRDGYTS